MQSQASLCNLKTICAVSSGPVLSKVGLFCHKWVCPLQAKVSSPVQGGSVHSQTWVCSVKGRSVVFKKGMLGLGLGSFKGGGGSPLKFWKTRFRDNG